MEENTNQLTQVRITKKIPFGYEIGTAGFIVKTNETLGYFFIQSSGPKLPNDYLIYFENEFEVIDDKQK